MKLLLNILWLLALCQISLAQYFPSEYWHEGYLVTIQGDSIKGNLKYDLENDLVQLDKDGRIQTFSSRKMTFFEIFDATTENYRKFYSIPYSVNLNYKVPRLFEVLYLGELTLATREAVVQEAISPTSSQIYGTRRRLTYRYYFIDKQGEVSNFNNKRSELLEVMNPKSPEIKSYIKKNNLRMDRMSDLVRITAFYNSI